MRLRPLLSSNPRALRFFVLALAWLQFVAPTWHICEMGGHVVSRSPKAHHGAAPSAQLAPGTPVICVCAPQLPPLAPHTPRLDALSSHDHATCLALLLQTMPGQVGVAVPFCEALVSGESRFEHRFISAPFCAASRRFRGRAPPDIC